MTARSFEGYNLRALSSAAGDQVRTGPHGYAAGAADAQQRAATGAFQSHARPAAHAGRERPEPAGMEFVLWPGLLLLAGAVIAFPFSLDARVATERLLGLVVAFVLAAGATWGLTRIQRPGPLLLGSAGVALLAELWVIAASGPDVFRGPVGTVLQVIARPVFGLAHVTDSVDVGNTRFIVGYNGLADLCLVVIFCCGALLLDRPPRGRGAVLTGLVLVSLVLLVGTGARGGLSGLAAGVCSIGLYRWPRRFALGSLLVAPAAIGLAALGIFDKGLEFSSTAGRLTYWIDLARLLVEYPLTGVGLGVNTANRVALEYEINPDPERIVYAHNTFVQAYLEQGPLGWLGMLLVPLIVVAAALLARRADVPRVRRCLLAAGLGIVGALEVHGLTDQVVTTNVGTGLVLLGLAGVVAALPPRPRATLRHLLRRSGVAAGLLVGLLLVVVLLLPAGRAQVLLNLGGLRANRALALDAQAASRAAALADAEDTLGLALGQDPGHPGVLRELARVRAARFDDAGALTVLGQASESPRLDAFDMLQIAHLYRDFGFSAEAYAWVARAYTAWGRVPSDALLRVYAQSTLVDPRARTLAEQGEAAMRARSFGEAQALFGQALTFAPDNAYLLDRLGAARRGVARYGGG